MFLGTRDREMERDGDGRKNQMIDVFFFLNSLCTQSGDGRREDAVVSGGRKR